MSLPFVSAVRPHLYFGPYPTQPQVEQLEQELGLGAIVNLTCTDELLDPYVTDPDVINIHIPIEDNSVPDDVPLFCALIQKVGAALRRNLVTYVHCKGGHGRSGMVCAILLCLLENLSPAESILAVTAAHRTRPQLREFWHSRPCPHLHIQRKFVYRMFTPLHWSPYTTISLTKGFSPWSPHRIIYEGQVYDSSFDVIKTYNGHASGIDAVSFMMNIMKVKFIQHPEILHSLLWTGFRPFVCKTDDRDDGGGKELSNVLFAVKMHYFNAFDRIPWTDDSEADGISKSRNTRDRGACEDA